MYAKWGNISFGPDKVKRFLKDLQKPEVRKIETWNLDYTIIQNQLNLTRDMKTYTQVASAIYNHYLRKFQPGSTRWGDKNNFFLRHIDTINEIFPEALFIHIVRDGRDVACSYRDMTKMKGKYVPRLPIIIGDIAYRWINNLKTIEDSLNCIDYRRSLIVRYEDLTSNSDKILGMICEFIDEPCGQEEIIAMHSFYGINKEQKLEPDVTMAWKKLTKKPLTTERIGRWKTELTEDEQKLFSFVARDKLIRYGYE
jgi:hypothetical protein